MALVAPDMSESSASHWYSYWTLLSPSASAMPEVFAVSVSPTWAVPLMVGAPVAGLLSAGAAVTAAVATLVSVSLLPSSSVKDTSTLMALLSSLLVRVYVEPVAPAISESSASHW